MIFEELYVEKVEENEFILTTIKNSGKRINREELSDYRNLESVVFKFDLFKEKICFESFPYSSHIKELSIILPGPQDYDQKKKPSEYWSDSLKEFSEDSWDRVWLNRTHMEPSMVKIRSVVEKFSRVERLDLIGDSFLAADTLIGLHKLKNLKKLVLKITKIEDKTRLLPLAKCKRLEELALLGEVFYLSGFDGLEELSFLKSLTFDKKTYFEYEERLEEHIHKWQKLETLNLTEDYEGDITPLVKCMNLKKLVIGKRLYIRGKKPLKENLPKGLHSYYEKIEEKPEEHGTLFIIENKRKIFRRK